MIKRGFNLLVLGAIGLILIVLYFLQLNNPDFKIGGFLSMIIVLVVLAYLVIYVIKIYIESKNVITTIVFALIPFIIGGISIFLLSNVFKVDLKVGDNTDTILIIVFMSLTYISPILCYFAFNFKKIK